MAGMKAVCSAVPKAFLTAERWAFPMAARRVVKSVALLESTWAGQSEHHWAGARADLWVASLVVSLAEM